MQKRMKNIIQNKDNVYVNATKVLAKQLCISAQFAELGTIQIFN